MKAAKKVWETTPVLAIGGMRRKAGKTSLVEAILRSFPELSWMAVKISTHRHRKLLAGMKELAHGPRSAAYRILEDTRTRLPARPPTFSGDTGRFLAAGSARSLLLEADETGIVPGLNTLLSAMTKRFKRPKRASPATRAPRIPQAIICETTRFAPLLAPDLFLMVVAEGKRAPKASSLEMLARADALVLCGTRGGTKSTGVRTAQSERFRRPEQKAFHFNASAKIPPALREFIRSRLFSEGATRRQRRWVYEGVCRND
jgi:hypothetical protein